MRKIFGQLQSKSAGLGPRQVRVIASDATPDRAGDILEPSGCDLSDYKSNPIVLLNHEADDPIGTASLSIANGRVEGVITFAPEGVSEDADEACALAKAGILRGASVGFIPIEAEPIRGAGVRYRSWKLVELSLVAVPANPSALVTEKSMRSKSGRAISAANGEKLFAARECIREAHDHISTVLGEGDEAKSVDTEHYRRRARAHALKIPPTAPRSHGHCKRIARLAALKAI